jgi:demethylmenaquinone methyltransferase/2-methoxy-6-polyprenyl-1,4-benzoquinol methylase
MVAEAMIGPTRSGSRVRAMFARIAHRYDLANHLLSGGLDWWWRRRVARIVREWAPRDLLDLATGSGDLALALQAACPAAQVVGADFCEEMLREAQRKGLAQTVLADALRMPFPDRSFDAVTVAFGLRNMESWPAALSEIVRVLRPGGRLLILDFALPAVPLRWLYRPYLERILPVVAGWLTGDRAAYEYLAESIAQFPSGDAMRAMLEEAGFTSTHAERWSGGIVAICIGTKPAG